MRFRRRGNTDDLHGSVEVAVETLEDERLLEDTRIRLALGVLRRALVRWARRDASARTRSTD